MRPDIPRHLGEVAPRALATLLDNRPAPHFWPIHPGGRAIVDRLAELFALTPEQVAASLEEWFLAGAADGFNIMPDSFPSGVESFVDEVVPRLRQRGLFRHEYQGSTLREHLGLPYPASRYEQPAAASA